MSLLPTNVSWALPVLLLGAGIACQVPQLAPEQVLALRQAQTRSYEMPLDTVFKASMSYLQDNFYQIRQASKENGIISAFKAQDVSGGQKILGSLLAGSAAKKGDAYEVTFTFDAVDAGTTQIRCNITHSENNLGGTQNDVRAMTDLSLYKKLLDGLSVEVHRRNMATDLRQNQPPGDPSAASHK
jgi:hypothetical protein